MFDIDIKLKKFVSEHKTAILSSLLAVTSTAAVLFRLGNRDHNNFLREHDLYETFYAPKNAD